MANSGIYEEDYGVDHESIYTDTDHTSPTDGYFEQREHPQQTFVENSSITAEAEAKAREAAENSRASGSSEQPPSSNTSPTSPTRPPVWADEATPLLDAGPAPPDYAAATAHRRTEAQAEQPSIGQSNTRTPNYGSIEAESPRRSSPTGEDDRQWPFGNRGNPLNSNLYPFGPQGNPFSNPNFPFGPEGSPMSRPNFPFGPQGPPQAMSNGPSRDDAAAESRNNQEEDMLQPRWQRPKRKWRRALACCQPMSLVKLLGVIAVVALMIAVGRAARTSKSSQDTPKEDDSDNSRQNHTQPNVPQNPAVPPTTDHPYPPGFPTHPFTTECPFEEMFVEAFDFASAPNFSLNELMEVRTNLALRLSGNIWIRSAPDEQDVDIRVFVSYATTSPWKVTSLHYIQEEQSLTLQLPNVEGRLHKPAESTGCMDLAVAISVKQDLQLNNLNIDTGNLNIKFEEGISHHELTSVLANNTALNARRGSIEADYWWSRQTIIDVVSGSVKGTYALHDLLSITSHSGQININVDPKAADPGNPVPADFNIIAKSGSVRVLFPTSGNIPDREYRSRVESQSGSITGDYIHGMSSCFHSASGSLSANVLPCNSHSYSTNLDTESVSGSTTLRVLPACDHDKGSLLNLQSSHKSVSSGSMRLEYPSAWTGFVQGDSISGSIRVHGPEVDVLKGDFGPGKKHIVAHKGYGDSKIKFRTISGSVDLGIGEH